MLFICHLFALQDCLSWHIPWISNVQSSLWLLPSSHLLGPPYLLVFYCQLLCYLILCWLGLQYGQSQAHFLDQCIACFHNMILSSAQTSMISFSFQPSQEQPDAHCSQYFLIFPLMHDRFSENRWWLSLWSPPLVRRKLCLVNWHGNSQFCRFQ